MTLLDEAIESLRTVPTAQQDHVAEAVFALVEQATSDSRLTPMQIEEVRKTLKGIDDGTIGIASEAEVEAMWRRLGA